MAIGVQHQQQQQHGTGSSSTTSSTSPPSQGSTVVNAAAAARRPLPITPTSAPNNPSANQSGTLERPLPNPHSPVSEPTTRSGVVISTPAKPSASAKVPVYPSPSPSTLSSPPPHRQPPPPGVAGSYSYSTSMGQSQSATATTTVTPSVRSISASPTYPSSATSSPSAPPAPPSSYAYHHAHESSISSAPPTPVSTGSKGVGGGLFKRALGGVVGGASAWRKKSDSAGSPTNSLSTPPIDGRRSPSAQQPRAPTPTSGGSSGGGRNIGHFASQVFNVTPTSKKSKRDLSEDRPRIPPTPPPKAGSGSPSFLTPGEGVFASHQSRPPIPVTPMNSPASAASLRTPDGPRGSANRTSIIPVTPAISSAVNYMRLNTPDLIEEAPSSDPASQDPEDSTATTTTATTTTDRRIVHEEDDDEDDVILVNKADLQGAKRPQTTLITSLRSAPIPRTRPSTSDRLPPGVSAPDAFFPPISAPIGPTTSFASAAGTSISTPSSPTATSSVASYYASAASPTQKDKELWRQSDSTIGHMTFRRPNAHAAMQESRPVSMADSVMSSSTVVPGSFATPTATIAGSPVGNGHKRLSALITDADFGTPEEFEEIEYSDVEGHEDDERSAAGSRSGFRDEDAESFTAPATPAKDRIATPLHAMYASAPASVSVSPSISSSSYNPSVNQQLELERQISLTPSSFSRKSKHSRSGSADISRPSSPSAASSKSKNRRSMSVSISSHAAAFSKTAARLLRSPERGTTSDTEGMTKIQQRRIYTQHSPDMSGYSASSLPRSRLNPTSATAPPMPPPPALSASPSRTSTSSQSWQDRSLPALPSTSPIPITGNPHSFPRGPPSPNSGSSRGQNPSAPTHGHHHSHAPSSGGFRQTAISITSGLAPAAGLAKRAVEKMGRAFGGHGHSQSYSPSGKESILTTGTTSSSSISSGTPPSSYSGVVGNELRRTGSNHSHSQSYSHPHQYQHPPQQERKSKKKIKLRRTPNAPSISSTASSVSHSTTASTSDSEPFFTPSGPILGIKLREGWAGNGTSVVFGRDLRSVVRDTAVWVNNDKHPGGESDYEGESEDVDEMGVVMAKRRTNRKSVKRGQLEALEERMLPAVVVRCAQHILIWGIQEEGLFRVPGRAAHITKLKAEFNSGADYDMKDCSPSELDPHAVASAFKAFLRELPEPILTRDLLPWFDAAMAQEQSKQAASNEDLNKPQTSTRAGPGLPANPRSVPASANPSPHIQMRKPPSLSTLAMPTFTAPRPSQSLVDAFHSCLSKLPVENRDLLRTVTDLIRATAKDSKDTKMPLSNLLLIFCPSLGMSPALLKVLCEAEGLWEERYTEVLDIKGDDVVLDIKGADSDQGPEDVDENDSSFSSADDFRGYTAREHIPTVYLDAESGSSSPLSQHLPPSLERSQTDDELSFVSTSEDQATQEGRHNAGSPPVLTSSAESLETPPPSSSISHPLSGIPYKDQELAIGSDQEGPEGSPVISTPDPRRPIISNPIPITEPVHFPSSPSGVIGPMLSEAEKRRSIQLLSMPAFSPSPLWVDPKFANASAAPEDGSQSPILLNASLKAKKIISKKPSLQLLFSKKSSSSLSLPSGPIQKSMISGPYLHAPHAASDSSMSTPISALTTHTAPQSSSGDLMLPSPANFDSPVESSPLKLVQTPATPPDEDIKLVRPGLPSSSSSSSLPASAHGTPIADRYARSASPSPSLALSSKTSTSQEAPPSSYHLRTTLGRSRGRSTGRERGISTSSSSSGTSGNHLGLLDDSEFDEDWTRTVLLAAGDLKAN